jgi:hypothetical protein
MKELQPNSNLKQPKDFYTAVAEIVVLAKIAAYYPKLQQNVDEARAELFKNFTSSSRAANPDQHPAS